MNHSLVKKLIIKNINFLIVCAKFESKSRNVPTYSVHTLHKDIKCAWLLKYYLQRSQVGGQYTIHFGIFMYHEKQTPVQLATSGITMSSVA